MNNKQSQLKDCEKIINFYVRNYKDRGVSEDEIREVCNKKTEELFEKYKDRENFNIIKDIKYTWFIRNEVTKLIYKNTPHVKVDMEMIHKVNEYYRTIRKLKNEGKDITLKNIAEKMNIEEKEVKKIEKLINDIDNEEKV